jgi:hypothetical protein
MEMRWAENVECKTTREMHTFWSENFRGRRHTGDKHRLVDITKMVVKVTRCKGVD